MNLLQDKWITVVRKNGEAEKIAPFEITDKIVTNPILEIITPRPDFKGALYQFLIGLFQTVYAPKDESEWVDRLNDPPKPEILKLETDKVAFAFDLFGKKIRFMQDMSLNTNDTQTNISSLFIDSPGENTLKENKDHFIKRDTIEKVCPICATLGIFTLQTNSPSGGQGHLTSIRGGGPLTTILKFSKHPHHLWDDIWLNIQSQSSIKTQKKEGKKYEFIFPWVINQFSENDERNVLIREQNKKLKDKSKKQELSGRITTIQDLHTYSVFWSYPRRILFPETSQEGICDVCGENSKHITTSYFTKTYGFDYGGGSWIHPLSPYYFKKDKELGDTWFPYHPQPGGILYENWQTIAYGATSTGQNAKVVRAFHELRKVSDEQTLIWAFGYDMDNMKARCWYESLIPIYRIPPHNIEKYESTISTILSAATQVANNLQTKVKDAWFNERQKPKGDTNYLKIIFFKATESKFFTLAKSIRDNLQSETIFDDSEKLNWLKYLNEESLKIFDHYVESGSIEYENIQRIVNARRDLTLWNFGDKIKKVIGLPIRDKKQPKEKTKNETI